MGISIPAMYIKGLNCYDGVMIAIAASLDMEYQLTYLDSFKFLYANEKGKLVGEKLLNINNDIRSNIDLYCGVIMDNLNIEYDINETVSSQLLNNMPVGVITNAFYCPWSFEYKKSDHNHYYLIVEEYLDEYKCIDTTMPEKYYTIHKNDMLLGTKQLVQFTYKPINNKFDYFMILTNSIKAIHPSEILDGLKIFIDDFVYIDYEKEFEMFQYSHWGCPIQRNLGFYTIGSIELYYNFISFMIEKTNVKELISLAEHLDNLKQRWNLLYNTIFRIYHSKNNEKYHGKAMLILSEIFDGYKKVLDQFDNILNQI